LINAIWELISGVAVPALVFAIVYPEKVKIIKGWFFSLFHSVMVFQRLAVSNDVEGKIEIVAKSLNSELGNVVPNGIKIKWHKADKVDKETFINDNKVIIKMNYSKNKNRNLAIGTALFVSKGLLPNGRKYVDKSLMESTDLTLTKQVLLKYAKQSMDYFYDEILEPAITSDPEISMLMAKLSNIDEKGMFTHIFLQEIKELGAKLYPEITPDIAVKQETKKVLDFLYNIATKESGEDLPLTYKGKYLSFGIVLVARDETIYGKGLQPYKKSINIKIASGAKNIYISAFSRKVKYAKQVANMFREDPRIASIIERPYKVRTFSRETRSQDGIFYILNVKDENVRAIG